MAIAKFQQIAGSATDLRKIVSGQEDGQPPILDEHNDVNQGGQAHGDQVLLLDTHHAKQSHHEPSDVQHVVVPGC